MDPNQRDELRILIITLIVSAGIISFGMIGYMLIEGWNALDALYQTVITISSVGFGEVHPLSTRGKIVTIFLITFAVTLFGYFFSRLVTVMVEGRLSTFFRGRKMERQIAKLRDHFIICGYGRMGNQVAHEFREAGVPFVVMDLNAATLERLEGSGMLWLVGDACRDEDLERCGIRQARGLVCVLAEDQYNVYAVLTARGLNQNLRIITRATEVESESKLRRAGADHVISPFKIGGSRIASMMLRPSINQFLDGLARAEEIHLSMIEVTINGNSPIAGKTISGSGIPDIFDCIIIGHRQPGKPLVIRPGLDTVLTSGDQLIIMGRLDTIQKVDALVSTTE